MSKQFAQVVLVVALVASAALAQEGPFSGTWKVNPSESKFGDRSRISQTTILTQAGDDLKSDSVITYEGENEIHTEWSAKLDGRPYPLTGDAHYDTILITKINNRTLKVVSKKGPEVSRSSQWVISSNGKKMTRTQKVLNAKGQNVDNVVVFDKQK